MGAPEDDDADRDVAEDAGDEHSAVEEGDEDQGGVVIHLHRPQHHLQVLRHLRHILLRGHTARLPRCHRERLITV